MMQFRASLTRTFRLVIEPSAELEIKDHRFTDWSELCEASGYIIWNRQGVVRVVPNEVLHNALRIYADYAEMVSSGRCVEMPKSARLIYWEQTDAVDR